jgi:hypothetical protein
VRLVPERDAPIAAAVIVTALVALAGVAEHQRPGRHQPAAERRPVLEAPRDHDGDRVTVVPLFEGAIARTGGADDIGDGPAVATREDPRRSLPRRSARRAIRQRLFELHRNFRQDPVSCRVL